MVVWEVYNVREIIDEDFSFNWILKERKVLV